MAVASPVSLRRLAYADLPQVVAIERRSFPAPWSLAMFVLELSKPASICLAAEAVGEPDDAARATPSSPAGRAPLAGYAVVTNHADVWHVMNIAIAAERRRQGVASALLGAVLEKVGPGAKLTLEVRRSNAPAFALYGGLGFLAAGVRPRYYADNGEDAVIMWRTPATLRGALDDVPNPSPIPQ